MKRLTLLFIIVIASASITIWASDDHKDSARHEETTEEHDHDHSDPSAPPKEGHHDENEHRHEEGSQVGPDKGILEADERHGIRLSPEAEKNFEIRRVKVASLPISVVSDAVVYAGIEENLFRYRQGFYKRIDFTVASKADGNLVIQSQHLKLGDEIVTKGLGFLRIAEIAAFGGAPEGHSH